MLELHAVTFAYQNHYYAVLLIQVQNIGVLLLPYNVRVLSCGNVCVVGTKKHSPFRSKGKDCTIKGQTAFFLCVLHFVHSNEIVHL